MRNAPLAAALSACALLFATGCEEKPRAKQVTVVGWGGSSQDAHRNAYWKSFTAKTGIGVNEDVWHGGIGVLRTKVHGGHTEWDVVQVEVEELILGCEEGLFEMIDWHALGGRDAYIEPSVHACGVGAMVWSQLFGFDGDRFATAPRNWADFWDVKRFPGKRGMRKTPKYTLEFALMADGVEPMEVYNVLASPGGVDRAFRKLDEIKPHVLWWTSISQVPDLLASGEVAMSVTSPGRLLIANRTDGRNFKVVWDGNIYAVDFWVILRGSAESAASLELIRYMKEAENETRLPLYIPTGLSRKVSIAALSEKLKRDTPSNPDNLRHAVALDAEFWVENTDQLTQRFNAWAAQ
jgi:putative spermidine/putrescine transport system substrate-binding protein